MKILKGDSILTQSQCNSLRGIAIIGIFLHNFCHWLALGTPSAAIKENEFTFVAQNSQNMWDYFTHGIDAFAPLQFLSFFGHYGVPIFLFLSGFGLVMKYERPNSTHVKTLPFLGYYWLKLFRLMILGYAIPTLIFVAIGAKPQTPIEVVSQLALVANMCFYPNPAVALPAGCSPYWFFGLMFEVYIVYRLFLYPHHDKITSPWRWMGPVIIILAAWIVQKCFASNTDAIQFMRYNVVIAALPFGMGILVGRFGLPKLPQGMLLTLAIVCLPLMAVASLNFDAWLWIPVVIVVGAVSFIKLFKSYNRSNYFTKYLNWVGILSSFIFVVHPIVRYPLFKSILSKHNTLMMVDYIWLVAYIIGTLVMAWLYMLLLKHIPSPAINKSGKLIIKK